MSLKSYFENFNIAEHQLKVARNGRKGVQKAILATLPTKPDGDKSEIRLLGSCPLIIIIEGQILGGKNNMIVTRTGHRFPKPAWAKWRNATVAAVKAQIPAGFKPYDAPVNARLTYVAGDRRRRDMPAIIDSIFHVLEKAGVVTDDTYVWFTESSRNYDKSKPRAVIDFLKSIE